MQIEIRDKLQTKREDYRKKIRKQQQKSFIKGVRQANNLQALRMNINLLSLFIDTPLGDSHPDQYQRYLVQLSDRIADMTEAQLDIINGCNLCLSLNHIIMMKKQPMLDIALGVQAILTGHKDYNCFGLPEDETIQPLIEAFYNVSKTKSDILWCLANFMTQNHSKKLIEYVSDTKFLKRVIDYMQVLTLENDNEEDIDQFSSICWFGQQYVQLVGDSPIRNKNPDLVGELFRLNQHLLLSALKTSNFDCGIISLSQQLTQIGLDIMPEDSELTEWINGLLDNIECLQLVKVYLEKFDEKYSFFMDNLIKLIIRSDIDPKIHQLTVQIILNILINVSISTRNQLNLMILDNLQNDTLTTLMSNCQWSHTSQYFLYLLIMDSENREGVLGAVLQQVKNRSIIISQLNNI